ncbi:MAG: hypothetical protein PVJ09_00940 [Candidatus Woesebacteria bacterium]|jgi:hypothetical protein
MRVLKFLFIFTIFVSIFIVFNLFVGRQALLYIATTRIKDSLKEMQNVERKGHFISECVSRGADLSGNDQNYKIQLRFISDKDYVLEVLCGQSTLTPIQIGESELPLMVKKVAGQSGIIWGEGLSGIKLDVYGEQAAVYVENKEIFSSLGEVSIDFDSGPLASCIAYGFQCCNDDTQSGSGDKMTGVTDCPKSCYSKCLEKPVILSFNTNPFFDTGTRRVRIKSGQSITFSYLVSDDFSTDDKIFSQETEETSNLLTEIAAFMKSIAKKSSPELDEEEELQVTLDFGDGTNDFFQKLQGLTEHIYRCNTGNCVYYAKLHVRKGNLKAADTVLSNIEVVVN